MTPRDERLERLGQPADAARGVRAGDEVVLGGERWHVIHAYGRGQAIADGVLDDVAALTPDEPDFARQAGWKVPVAMTAAVTAIVLPNDAERGDGQDVKGRLWDLLWMSCLAARAAKPSGSTPEWSFRCVFWLADRPEHQRGRRHQATLTLKGVLGGDDLGEPCVTLMLPSED